jgi:glycosyltransferase involved in cell wall biosynthesis
MLEGRLIVCLASAWDYDPTSKHQIMKRLAGANEIVWVNYHGTRPPTATAADAGAIARALRRVLRGVQPINEHMVQVTPLVIPGTRRGFRAWLHERLLVWQLRQAARQMPGYGRLPLQVWTFAPDVAFLPGKLGEERFVYYCVDEYSEFEGFDRESIIASERQLLERADVVITTSAQLHESKRAFRRDAHLVRHGVDHQHFARALTRRDAAPPDDLPALGTPTFGFFGLIHHWIDRDLIARAARLRPHYSFVLIGDVRVEVSELRGLPNVHLLGRRPYESLPDYCAHFTAGLLPFTRTSMTRNINPIKMLEYLAAGLPVVSTPLPEADRWKPFVRVAEDPEAFVSVCDDVVRESRAVDRAAISEAVYPSSWDAIVERLSDLVTGEADSERQTDRDSSAHLGVNLNVSLDAPHLSSSPTTTRTSPETAATPASASSAATPPQT